MLVSGLSRTMLWSTLAKGLSHAYSWVVFGDTGDTPHDERVGNKPKHGIHFCTQIQAIHRRATKLLGLYAIRPDGHEEFRLDKIERRQFDRIFAKKEGYNPRELEIYDEV